MMRDEKEFQYIIDDSDCVEFLVKPKRNGSEYKDGIRRGRVCKQYPYEEMQACPQRDRECGYKRGILLEIRERKHEPQRRPCESKRDRGGKRRDCRQDFCEPRYEAQYEPEYEPKCEQDCKPERERELRYEPKYKSEYECEEPRYEPKYKREYECECEEPRYEPKYDEREYESRSEPKYEREYKRKHERETDSRRGFYEKKPEDSCEKRPCKKHKCEEPCFVIDNIVECKSIPGPRGAPGPQGPRGATGATGPTGLPGIPGVPGVAGATGAQGIPGIAGATGATGAAGTAGATGATGATGAAGGTTQFRGIQTAFSADVGGTLADGANVLFDTIINDQSTSVTYNAATGEFTIGAVGNYFVSWWVNTDGAGASTNVAFGITVNGGGAVIGSSPVTTGQVSGSALITIPAAPATLALVNVTGDTVNYAVGVIKANLTLLEVTV